MGAPQTRDTTTSPSQLESARLTVTGEDTRAMALISKTNRDIEAAGRRLGCEPHSGREAARGLLRQFSTAATAIESLGWSAARIREYFEASS